MYDDFSVGDSLKEIDTGNYRWGKAEIVEHTDNYNDPKLLITCNLNISLTKDYILTNFYHDFLWNNHIENACYYIDHANIRGYQCNHNTISITSISSTAHFHVDTSNCDCNCCQWNNRSVSEEYAFGVYLNSNPQFSCVETETSTTNFWIGKIVYNQVPVQTTPFYTTQQIETSSPPTIIPIPIPTDTPSIQPTNTENAAFSPNVSLIDTTQSDNVIVLASSKHEQILVVVIAALLIGVLVALGCLIVKIKKHREQKNIFEEKRMKGTHFSSNIKSIYDEYSDSQEDHHITTDVMDSSCDDRSGRETSKSPRTRRSKMKFQPFEISGINDEDISYDKLKIIEESEEISFSSVSKTAGEDAAILPCTTSTTLEHCDTFRLL